MFCQCLKIWYQSVPSFILTARSPQPGRIALVRYIYISSVFDRADFVVRRTRATTADSATAHIMVAAWDLIGLLHVPAPLAKLLANLPSSGSPRTGLELDNGIGWCPSRLSHYLIPLSPPKSMKCLVVIRIEEFRAFPGPWLF